MIGSKKRNDIAMVGSKKRNPMLIGGKHVMDKNPLAVHSSSSIAEEKSELERLRKSGQMLGQYA